MYVKVGKQLKFFAAVFFISGLIFSFVCFFEMKMEYIDIVYLLLRILISYILSLLIYGFGEIIDKSFEISKNTKDIARNTYSKDRKSEKSYDKISTLEDLKAKGLVTDNEYSNTLSKL